MTRLLRTVPVVLAMLASLFVATAPPASAAGFQVKIQNANSQLCLKVKPGYEAEYAGPYQQNDCGTAARWDMTYVMTAWGVQFYKFQNLSSPNYCLAASSVVTDDPVWQMPCASDLHQTWGLMYVNNKMRLYNAYNGACMAVPNASTAPGERVNTYPCGDFADHYWNIIGAN